MNHGNKKPDNGSSNGPGKPYVGYLFAYFTGNTREGECIRFALSDGNDALTWVELNGGRPVLSSTLGTTGLRDPFLIRGKDGFHLLATDLSIGSGTSWADSQRSGSRSIEIWSSHDLVNWSEQRHVEIAPRSTGNAWAPEAIFDEGTGGYLVFWASAIRADAQKGANADVPHRMLCAWTRDFTTFSQPKIWQDPGWSVIDATILRVGNAYHRFTKNDRGVASWADVIQEVSFDPCWPSPSPAWHVVTDRIGADAGLGPVEGPIAFAANPGDANGQGYYLFLDEYTGRGYVPLFTENLDDPRWRVPARSRLPTDARHGSVIAVTATEVAALRHRFGWRPSARDEP